mmetsp:Transcript_17192/g.56956  ORF Transcript_17192/g.56956 Transcript_17192/m.56956 type:complete len:245 (-) Transcript_17192:678-1412(-)
MPSQRSRSSDPPVGAPAHLAQALSEEFADVLVDDLPQGLQINRPPQFDAHIQLKPGTLPINCRPYRIPLHLEGELQATIAYMLEHDIIEPSNSPRSPTDPKSYRFCCDLRRLNQVVLNQQTAATPTVDEMLEKIADTVRQGKARRKTDEQLCITTLDCIKGFWQVLVRVPDRRYLAFITPIGHYQYKRLPFGFITAPPGKLMPITFAPCFNAVASIRSPCLRRRRDDPTLQDGGYLRVAATDDY